MNTMHHHWLAPVVAGALGLGSGACAGGSDDPCETASCPGGGIGLPVFDGSTGQDADPTDSDTDDDPAADDSSGDDADPDGSTGASQCQIDAFEFSGTEQGVALPEGARYLHVKAWGAGGNHEDDCGPHMGGVGGYTEAVFEVQGGELLTVIVGEYGNYNQDEIEKFGFGGSGGGGLSGVFMGDEPLVDTDQGRALVIAGGGGSAARQACSPGGPGNHPQSGGMPTMQGDLVLSGGGGGYFGGTGGGDQVAAAGGTGFVAAGATDSAMLFSEPGDPLPPNADDPDVTAGTGTQEHNGYVQLYVYCHEDEIPPLPRPVG